MKFNQKFDAKRMVWNSVMLGLLIFDFWGISRLHVLVALPPEMAGFWEGALFFGYIAVLFNTLYAPFRGVWKRVKENTERSAQGLSPVWEPWLLQRVLTALVFSSLLQDAVARLVHFSPTAQMIRIYYSLGLFLFTVGLFPYLLSLWTLEFKHKQLVKGGV